MNLSDSNLLNLNLGMKILLSKSASMLAFLLTSSVELTETWIMVNNILQIVNHVYNLGWEVMLWDTAICLLFVTANFFAQKQKRGCFNCVKLQFSMTNLGKHWLLMLNQILFTASIYFLHQPTIMYLNTDGILSCAILKCQYSIIIQVIFCFWWVVFPTSKMKIAKSFDLCMHEVKQKKRKCWPLQGT